MNSGLGGGKCYAASGGAVVVFLGGLVFLGGGHIVWGWVGGCVLLCL